MTLTHWTLALGGLGLLLLGMQLLTEGLKTAAGSHLQQFLERSTQTRARAALSGFAVTAVVQSSSAVVVALLGFTNAGMLKLRQAAWVLFGSNVGTTMTAWIVALIGLKINIGIIAWPLIGLGMLLQLLQKKTTLGSVGLAIAGFGVLFVGLDTLRDAFELVVTLLPVEQLQVSGIGGILLAVAAGTVLTILVQSSSAALAIILTASVSGIFSPLAGAAVVIGANIGTTATAILASFGATAHAKRLSAVHVLMNAVTGLTALVLLVPLWLTAEWLAGGEQVVNISTGLAVFHTLFNAMGLGLMWLLDERIFRAVERWYRLPALRSGEPRFLDKTILEVPAMGLRAVQQEQARVLRQYQLRLRALLRDSQLPDEAVEDIATGELLQHIAAYLQKLSTHPMQGDEALQLTELYGQQARLLDLRQLVEKLAVAATTEIDASLAQGLRELLLELLSGSQMNERSPAQWQTIVSAIQSTRSLLRSNWLQQIARAELAPTQGVVLVQLASHWERCAVLLAALENQQPSLNYL
ncbi:Na/Pi cotransporter family protein [Pseudidiomarina salilacus]|uniref:Na/Pi cotransporter family protein n=1 Tax=Pseudidiomarina salilacus TaxID=3384452 RepID=UPI0039854B06